MTTLKNPAAVALQALRKTKSGGRNGGTAKHPRKGMGSATPEERQARAALMVAARRAVAAATNP